MTPTEAAAAAGMLLAERVRVLQFGAPLGGEKDEESPDEWIDDVAKLLAPLGDDGAAIAQCLMLMLERSGDMWMYRATAQINRAVQDATGSGGIVEHIDGGGAVHHPGENATGEHLLRLLLPWKP